MNWIHYLTIICIAIYFLSGCGKAKESQISFSLYCATDESLNDKCQHLCDGRWARKIGDLVLYFETEQECLK